MPRSITPRELKSRLDRNEAIALIDVREPSEREIATIGGALIPMGEVLTRVGEIPQDREVVVYCRSGGRSGRVIQELEKRGMTNLINLDGGILRWADEVDSTIQKY